MDRQPAFGRFGVGLSYGLPVGVAMVGLLALISDDPDIGALSRIGLFVAVAAALFATKREKTEPDR